MTQLTKTIEQQLTNHAHNHMIKDLATNTWLTGTDVRSQRDASWQHFNTPASMRVTSSSSVCPMVPTTSSRYMQP